MRIKFSIRDLLFVIVVCALIIGWFVDHDAVRQTKSLLKKQIEAMQAYHAAKSKELNQEKQNFETAQQKMIAKEDAYFEMVARYKEEFDKLEKEKADLHSAQMKTLP